MVKKTYKVSGMNCASCASMIELDLEDAGIKAKCSYPNSSLEVEGKHDPKKVIETVKKSGYSVLSD
jgi:copper chaperone CopZ